MLPLTDVIATVGNKKGKTVLSSSVAVQFFSVANEAYGVTPSLTVEDNVAYTTTSPVASSPLPVYETVLPTGGPGGADKNSLIAAEQSHYEQIVAI